MSIKSGGDQKGEPMFHLATNSILVEIAVFFIVVIIIFTLMSFDVFAKLFGGEEPSRPQSRHCYDQSNGDNHAVDDRRARCGKRHKREHRRHRIDNRDDRRELLTVREEHQEDAQCANAMEDLEHSKHCKNCICSRPSTGHSRDQEGALNGCNFNPSILMYPDQWPNEIDDSMGQRQSPINISTCSVIYIPPGLQKPLVFNKQYFVRPLSMTVLNDGYSVLLGTSYNDEYPILSGGPLNSRYRFNLAQFKWGPTNDEGSEHTIDSKRYPMEMQLMHIKGEKVFDTLEEATLNKAVVYISFLFELTRQDNPFISPLVDQLHKISEPNMSYPLDPFPLCWLFQPFKSKYFYYEGSITHPPCTEGAEWIIQPEPLSISSRQLNSFRSLSGYMGPIRSNARPVQKLNNRKVHYFM